MTTLSYGKGRGKKYIYLLKNKNIKRWYDNVARGSVVTADVYLRRFGKFCEDYKITPEKLIKMGKKARYNFLLDVVSGLEKQNCAGSYIASVVKAVKSWLAFNGISITRKIRIKDVTDTPTLKEERIPTQPELKKIFLSGEIGRAHV